MKGIAAEHFGEAGSMERSLEEIHTILKCMHMDVPVLAGETGPVNEMKDGEYSDAANFIVEEALRDDPHPLFLLCQGAITNVAAAFRKYPEIISRVTVIWIGTHGCGNVEAPFREFNAGNDITAANEVLSSGVELWLVPSQAYTTITIGLAEIQRRIYPCGEIGKHLFENMIAYNNSEFAGWTQGESWSLGDSPAIGLALNPGCGTFAMKEAPEILEDTSSREKPGNPMVRLYTSINTRYLLEDLIAKLELFAEG